MAACPRERAVGLREHRCAAAALRAAAGWLRGVPRHRVSAPRVLFRVLCVVIEGSSGGGGPPLALLYDRFAAGALSSPLLRGGRGP